MRPGIAAFRERVSGIQSQLHAAEPEKRNGNTARRQTIGRPKNTIRGYFWGFFMPKSAKRMTYRGLRKTIVSVFRD
jgi:hypothetical protein